MGQVTANLQTRVPKGYWMMRMVSLWNGGRARGCELKFYGRYQNQKDFSMRSGASVVPFCSHLLVSGKNKQADMQNKMFRINDITNNGMVSS